MPTDSAAFDPVEVSALSADVLQADVTRCGGISGFLQIGALCEAHHIDLSGHCAPALHRHVACSVPRLRHLEWFHDHVRIEQMLFEGAPKARDGAIEPDLDLPGHGLVFKEKDAERMTQELNEAYGVLGDAEKRAAYDELGRGHQYRAGQEFRPPPEWGNGMGGGADSSDFFADLFANLGGGRRRGGGGFQQRPTRGEDSHASIIIDLLNLPGISPFLLII